MKKLDFYFDFGSPNAYLSYKAIGQILDLNKIQIVYKPVLLGGVFKATNNQSPFMAMANITGKLAYEQLEVLRFIEKYNLSSFQMNSHFPVNTLQLMRGAMVAEARDEMPQYIEGMFNAMWEQSKKMDDLDVFLKTLDEIGLESAAYADGITSTEVKQALMDCTQAGVDRGIFGIPTFFVDDQMWFGKDRIHQINDYLGQE